MPANLLYPEALAQRAAELAKECGFTCTVLDRDALTEQGMGSPAGRGSGLGPPPCLVVLEHAPQGHEQEKPVIFVGKGITFDTGGICLKPAANMQQMKCDMTGAATVLAVVAALAREDAPAPGRGPAGLLPRTCPTVGPCAPATWCARPTATAWKS